MSRRTQAEGDVPSESPAPPASEVFQSPDLAKPGQALSAAEAGFFLEHGFLVKPGLLDAESLASAMERVWKHLHDRVPLEDGAEPPRPDDPRSWNRPRWAAMPPADESGFYQGRQRIVHAGVTVKLHDLGDADFLLALVPNHPGVRRVARELLGDDLRRSERTRGVYAVFPDRDAPAGRLGPHTDRVCQQLNACVYLEEVEPRGGGFTVYPGSHRIMFRAHRSEANWSPLPNFRDALRRVVREIRPVEFAGEAGTVVFWHGRTVHSAGLHSGDRIRWAVFADFTLNREVLSPDEHRALGQYEWFKDAKLFRDDPPAGENMWRAWKIGPDSA